MTAIPLSDELRHASNLAAALERNATAPSMSLGQVTAIAQQAVGHLQALASTNQGSSLLSEDSALVAIASSRSLHAVSHVLRKAGMVSDAELMLLHAAASYGMYGNFPSAKATLRELPEDAVCSSDPRSVAAAVLDPSRIGSILKSPRLGGVAKDLVAHLEYFFQQGDTAAAARVGELFDRVMLDASQASDGALMRSARLALQQAITLGVSRSLGAAKLSIPQEYIRAFTKTGVYTLLPPQYRMLTERRISEYDANGLLSLPTSTGKTLLAECCLISSLSRHPGLAVFVAPYVAIGAQVANSLERRVPKTYRVHSMFGGFQLVATLDPSTQREIIVATPERFDALLRTEGVLDKLRIVVFDEAHLVENGMRGLRLEGLIARLRIRQDRGKPFRMLAMSAVLNDTSKFRDWLGVTADQIYTDTWRPTARRLAVWRTSGKLQWLYGGDPIRPAGASNTTIMGSRNMIWPNDTYPTDKFGATRQQLPASYANAAYLARSLTADFGGPILIVCGTKAGTRGVARTIAASEAPDDDPLDPARERLIRRIDEIAPHLADLRDLVRRRVAFHNSTVPIPIRLAIEAAVRARTLHYVAATTTLAEGADLPFRITIVNDWLVYSKDAQRPMAPLLFRNIAGRCGRAGEFAEGDTIVIENLLGNFEFTNDRVRVPALRTVFSDPPALTSAAEDIVMRSVSPELNATIASQFLAAIPENADTDNLDEVFARHTYAYRILDPQRVETLITQIKNDLLASESGVPLATQASPLKLTNVGRAARFAGLSPQTARQLLAFLQSDSGGQSDAHLCVQLLLALGNAPEQPNHHLREQALGKNPRVFWKRSDLSKIVEEWLNAVSVRQIFEGLEGLKKSTAGAEYMEAQYDYFIEFTESVLVGFLPWMLRSCSVFQEFATGAAKTVNWMQLADRFTDRESTIA